tara:strand:+ start:239 stop:1645 length:1407 start_codon:yes stop_codon:yes gene_type:complete
MLSWNYLSSDVVEKLLRIKRSGKKDGVENLPKSSAKRLSSKEQEIISHCKGHFSRQVQGSIDGCRAVSTNINKFSSEINANGLKNFIREAKQNLEKIFFDAKVDIDDGKKEVEKAEREKQRFIVNRGLEDHLREPKKRTYFKFFGSLLLIAALAAVEIWLNYSSLYQVLGIPEARVIASLVSAINIGLSFIIGLSVLRYLLNDPSRTTFEKIFDRLKVTGYVLLLIYSNFLIAATRAVPEVASMQETQQEALEILGSVIWPFQWEVLSTFGGPSIYLLMIGAFFSIISMMDGYYFDDKIPGYGDIGRNLDKAEKQLKVKILKNKNILHEEKKKVFNDLEQREKEREAAAEEWALLQDEMQIAVNDYDAFIDDLAHTQQDLIDIYRENNTGQRSKEEPSYFSEKTDTSYLKSFEKVHTNIYHELVLNDKEKTEHVKTARKIIHSESEAARGELIKVADDYKDKLDKLIT